MIGIFFLSGFHEIGFDMHVFNKSFVMNIPCSHYDIIIIMQTYFKA